MQANIDVLLLRNIRGASFGPNIETDDYHGSRKIVGLSRRSEQYVRFGDRTDTGPNHAYLDLLGRKFLESRPQHLDRTLNVGLKNNEELFDFGLAERFDTAFRRLDHRGLTGMHLTLVGDVLSSFDIGDYLDRITRLRNTLKSEDLDRCRRRCFSYRRTRIREHRPDLAVELSGNKRIAYVHRSLLHQDRRDRSATLVELRFQNNS